MDFDQQIGMDLADLRDRGLWRELRTLDSAQGREIVWGGRALLNFSSNDYLGLAVHAHVKASAVRAVERFGGGSGASRLICGSLAVHRDLEERLADFKRAPAALTFANGYGAFGGLIGAMMSRGDVIIVDKRIHASCVDAARASDADLRVFAHNDLEDLERKLKWADRRGSEAGGAGGRRRRVLVVTESVFSMDGDVAPLRDIVEMKDRYGAWLMVDEAHATGMYGERRSGLVEEFGVSDRVEVQLGTLGKALGAAGGYIAGSRPLVDLLINKARSFVYSTAPVPAQSGAAMGALDILASAEGQLRVERLWAMVELMKTELLRVGWAPGLVRSPILPLVVGGEEEAMAIAAGLRERGFFIPAIRFPTVARGAARLRVTLSACHGPADVTALAEALAWMRHPEAGPGGESEATA